MDKKWSQFTQESTIDASHYVMGLDPGAPDPVNQNVKITMGGLVNFINTNTAPDALTSSMQQTVSASVQTTNATPTLLLAIPLSASSSVKIDGVINAYDSTFTNNLSGSFNLAAQRKSAGNIFLANNVIGLALNSDTSAALSFVMNTTAQQAEIWVTGVAATTFKWISTINYRIST